MMRTFASAHKTDTAVARARTIIGIPTPIAVSSAAIALSELELAERGLHVVRKAVQPVAA